MALPILDGNQTAATLSTIITGGAHIPAHTVVSLGSQAISDITSAVSGASISIGSSVTIAGTVTANVDALLGDTTFTDSANVKTLRVLPHYFDVNTNENVTVDNDTRPLPISGTVTANVSAIYASESNFDTTQSPLIVAGGVIGGNEAQPLRLDSNANLRVSVNNSVTISSVPKGSLTTRFGTPTTANVSFATAAVTNSDRKYLLIQNVTTGSNVITVGIGFTPTTTQGIQLTAGAGITFESSYIPTGAVHVLSSVTASNFTILEA